jgi:hypothetical protein
MWYLCDEGGRFPLGKRFAGLVRHLFASQFASQPSVVRADGRSEVRSASKSKKPRLPPGPLFAYLFCPARAFRALFWFSLCCVRGKSPAGAGLFLSFCFGPSPRVT